MDIYIVAQGCLRLKGKRSAFVVDPTVALKSKTAADAVIILSEQEKYDLSKIEESRVTIKGPGEYEVSGTKITAFRNAQNIVYSILIDGLSILLGKTDAIEAAKEKLGKHNVLLIKVEGKLNEETIAALEPNVVIFYGDGAEEAVKALGKQTSAVSKYSVTFEKLPEEMETVVLK